MNAVVPLFLIAPLVLVPLGYRLLEVATPGSGPPAIALSNVLPAAGLIVISFWFPPGLAATVLAFPWLAVTGVTAVAAGLRLLRDPDRFHPGARHATDAAVAFLAVGAAFAFTDRLGARPFDFASSIILLTAVHFHFAGFVLPLAGALAYGRRPRRGLEAAIAAVVVGIPITALGFFGIPLANWSGAVLTAVGGIGIGLATILVATKLARRSAVVLAATAGASLLVSMPMAIVYATGTLTGSTWLAVETMARIHGGLNALGFALPVIVAWTLDRRARAPVSIDQRAIRDPRRLGLGAAAIIVGYAVVVGGISAGLIGGLVDAQVGPPAVVPRPILLAALFMVPAAIAAIGAVRRSSALLGAAGVLCICQSFIAFSGVTIPFVVPGFLLLALGAHGSDAGGTDADQAPSVRRRAPMGRAAAGALAAVVLGIGAWFAFLTLTDTECWVARTGPDGTLVYETTPVTDTFSLGANDVAAGCDGGQTTVQGAVVAAVLGVSAVAVAILASMSPPRTAPAPSEAA